MKRILTLLTLVVGFLTSAQSQVLLDQCESLSGCNARVICGTSTIVTPFSYTTSTTTGPIGTCAGGTPVLTYTYSTTPDWVFYRFTCYGTGTLNFRISSNDSATTNSDLDWALWNITSTGCGTLGIGNLVECNAALAGATGIQPIGNANFEPSITITAGNTYILGISNNSVTGNHGGHTLSFGGTTANITDNVRPYMQAVAPFDPCSPVSSIKIKLSEPVRCDQLNAVNGEFSFSGAVPTYTVTPIGCSGCVNAPANNNPNFFGNATDSALVTFASPIPPGLYTITAITNAWRDLCANPDSIQATLTFTVPAPFKDTIRSGFDCVNLKYLDTICGQNGTSPYQYKAVGGGLPASAGNYGTATPGCAVYAVSGGTPVTYTVRDALGCEQDTTINRPSVLALGAPNLSLSAGPPCNNQFALDSIFVSSQSGGTPFPAPANPYNFTLTSTSTFTATYIPPNKWKNIVFGGLGATFTVTVTDANGCTRTGVRNMVNPSNVSLTLNTPNNPLCFGDSSGKVCFNQAGGGTPASPPNLYVYSIAPNYTSTTLTTTPTFCFNNLPAGIYTVTAADGNGCTTTGTRTLSQPALMVLNTSPATILNPTCPNNCNGTYQPIATGGTGGKRYFMERETFPGSGVFYTDSVATPITTNKFLNLCAGTYTVMVRDAVGCTITATVTLSLPPSPSLNLGVVTPVACFGGNGTITANVTGGQFPPTAYTSSAYTFLPATPGMTATASGTGGVNVTFANVPQGTYTLIVTNNNACADTIAGVVMTQPAAPVSFASVVVDSVLCFGTNTGTITAQAAGGTVAANSYQYAIRFGAGPFSAFSAPTLAPFVFPNLAAGTYTIRVRDHNLCILDSIVTIDQPPVLDITLDDVDATCFGTSNGEICVFATGGVSGYQYKLGAAGIYSPVQAAGSVFCFNSLAAATYMVYARDTKGCEDSISVTVASIPLPVVSYNALPNDTVCDGTAISLCGTGADTYIWTGGITDCNAFTPALGTSTYTVTGTNTTTGCSNTAIANVLVNPIPAITPVANQVVCNNAPTAAVNFNSSVPGSTFTWSHDGAAANSGTGIGIATPGNGNIPSFTALNIGNTPIVVTFTATPTGPASTNCLGADITFTITINPTPVLTDPNDQQLCAGDLTNAVNFVSTVVGSSFNWINNNTSTGLANLSGSGDIPAFIGLNPGTTPNISIVTVTPSANGCPGADQTFTITIDPIPAVVNPGNQVVCNGESTAAIVFNSAVTGTTFSWINTDPSIGLAASGTGNIPSFTAINTGSTPIIATICVTPTGPNPTNCNGAQLCFTITVNPTPDIASITSQDICAGSNTTAIVFGSGVSGTTYTWTNTNPSIGLGAASAGAVTGIPAFTGINVTNVPQTGTITVTASANTCPGASTSFDITVHPNPVADPVANQTVCDNEFLASIVFSSNIPFTTFNYSYSASAFIGIPFNGTNATPAFTATNTGTVPVVATFTVTPIGPAPTNCPGTPINFTITVLPRQNPTFFYPSATYCQTGINPLPVFDPGTTLGGTFTADPAGLVINPSTGLINLAASALNSYTITYTTPGPCPDSTVFILNITLAPTAGFGYSAASYCQTGPNPAPVFTPGASGGVFSAAPAGLDINPVSGIINLSGSNAGTYTVTNFIAAAGGCAAATATTTVTIDSTTVLTAPADQIVCNGEATSAVILNASVAGSTYTWSHNGGAGIGILSPGTGNIPSFTAINTGTSSLVVTFTVTPVGPAPNNCAGNPVTFTITIHPTPDVLPVTNQLICAGDNTDPVIFSGGVAGTVFNWVNNNTTTGLINLSGTGDIPSFVGLNPGFTPNISVVTVTPTANGCPGAFTSFTITVDPIPDVILPANQSVCNGASTSPLNFGSSVAGATFDWINTDPSIGLAASGTGNIPSFTAINNGTTPVVATICVTPTGPNPTNCAGSQICFTITVNPTPDVDPISNQQWCAGDVTTLVTFSGSVSGTTYTWTNSNVAIGLAANSGGPVSNLPSFTTVNGTFVPQTGTITVSSLANGCPGASTSFDITVDPIPTVNAVANQVVCDNESTADIIFGGNVFGTIYNWSYTASSNIGLAFTGTGDIPAFTAINTGTTPIVATFTVTPVGPSPTDCDGADITFTITVLPRQLASFSYALSTYCQTGVDPLPIYGAGTALGGTFSAIPGGLAINPVSGLISLLPSSLNTYTVSYVTPGPCPDSSTFTVTITLAPTAGFGYASANYCQNGTAAPTFAPSASAGNFTASPAGLSINASTGVINLAASNAGTYTVSNDIPAAGGCAAANATTTVTIDSTTVLTQPANQTVCHNTTTAVVSLTSTVSGTTYTWSHNGGAGIGIATSGTGNIPSFTAINNGTSPVIVTFTVEPTGPAPNNCVGVSQTFTITIDPIPVANNPGNQVVCHNAATAAINFTSNVTNSTFNWTCSDPTIGLAATGTGNIPSFTANNTGSTPVVATICVTPIGPAPTNCPGVPLCFTITVNPSATLTLTSGNNAQIVCEGTPITPISYTIGGTGSSASATNLPPGIIGTLSGNVFTLSGAPTASGNYTYTITATGSCASGTISGSIEVTPLQNPSFTYPFATNCQVGTTAPNSIATPGGTFSATPAGLVFTNTTTGDINLATSLPNVYTIKYVTPGPCPDSSTLVLTVTNAPSAEFSYGAAAYCQSSPNPCPVFLGPPNPSSAGVFSSIPAGVSFVSTSTGCIDLLASTPGVYQIVNFIAASGVCPQVSDTFTVTISSKPSLSVVSSTQAGCIPNCDGTVTTAISGGTGAYTCSIAPSGTVTNAGFASNLCAGTTYTITATDGIGCTGTITVSVTTAPSPTISLVSQTNTSVPGLCDGTATTLTVGGTPGYTYAITGAGTPLINALGVATQLCGDTPCVNYVIIVTDTKGCKDTVDACIFEPGALNCTPSHTDVTCFGGSNGSLAVSVSGGTTPYNFVSLVDALGNPVPFTPAVPVNSISATGLPAGSYTATWSDSNNVTCTSVITILQPNPFVFTVDSIYTPGCIPPSCNGTMSISAAGGTGTLSYSIITPSSTTCTAAQTTPGNFTGLGIATYTIIVTDALGCTGSTTVQINASPLPSLSLTGTNPSCHNVCDGTIVALGSGGTGALGYGITSPSGALCTPTQPTSGNFATLGGGTYLIVVTDAKGCNTSSSINLVNPPLLTLNPPASTSPSCFGDCNASITLTGVGGTGVLTYTIAPPFASNTTGVFTGLCAGNYNVSVTDASNCTITGNVQINDPAQLIWSIAISNNITCAGTVTGVINTTAAGGTGAIQYSLNGSAFGASGNYTALAAGNYTVTARDANNCSITTNFTIVEPPILLLSAPVITNVSCNAGSDGTITTLASGGTPGYVYTITPPAAVPNTTGVFTGLPAGTYAITVTDSAGCTRTATNLTITQPAPLIYTLANHQDVACFGDTTGSITVNTQGGTGTVAYALNPATGTQGPAGFFSGLIAGSYTVTATDQNNCAVSTVILVNQGPELVFVNISTFEPTCHGDSTGRVSFTIVGGTGQLRFQLDGGPLQTDTFFNNVFAGNHQLTVVDALGCTESRDIIVTEPDPVGAIINAQDANCIDSKDGRAIIIGTGGRGGYTYYVTPGLYINKSGIIVGLEAGIYNLRIVDTSGCEYTTQFTINPPANPLSNTITKQDLACNGVGNEGRATANVNGGTPPYTYLWSTTPTQTTATATTLYFGYYDVTVIDANGCVIKDTVYIEEGPCCDVAFIPNAFSPNGDQVNDEFRVLTTAGVQLIQLEIYNRWGQRVWSTGDYRRGWDGRVEGQDAPVDTYYYVLRYTCTRDNSTYTKKGDVILLR
jgi:gliding motility-associated-like protein